jgi:hypothetical protein
MSTDVNTKQTVKILGEKVSIVIVNEPDTLGQYHHDDRRIDIHSPHPDAMRTLLHEIIHASLAISGLTEVLGDKTEEAVCRCLEIALPHAYRMTPKFVRAKK